MNSYLIQSAFQSLNDIYKNEKLKEALAEGRRKEHLKRCAGNPDINTSAFNHATDIGASSPSTGLGETLDKDELQNKYVGKKVKVKEEEGEITSLKVDNGDFDTSIWEVVLNDGKKIEIKGNEVSYKDKLEEKVPKDVISALKYHDASLYGYRKTQDTSNGDKTQINQLNYLLGYRKGVRGTKSSSAIDFDKAEFKEISKEEALKYTSPKKRYQLLLLLPRRYGGTDVAQIFDKDSGKPLFDINNNTKFKNSTPIKELINSANKIYWTNMLDTPNLEYDPYEVLDDYTVSELDDEGASIIDKTRSINTDLPQEVGGDFIGINSTNELDSASLGYKLLFTSDPYYLNFNLGAKYSDSWGEASGYSYSTNISSMLAQLNPNYSSRSKIVNHINSTLGDLNYRYKMWVNNSKDTKLPDEYRQDSSLFADKIKRVIKILNLYKNKNITFNEFVERFYIILVGVADRAGGIIKSPLLMKAEALKHYLNILKQIYKDKRQYVGKYYTRDDDYRNFSYYLKNLKDRMAHLQDELKELTTEINDYTKRINDIKDDYLQSGKEDAFQDVLIELGERLKNVKQQLDNLGMKSKVSESLDRLLEQTFNLRDPDDIKEAKKLSKQKVKEKDYLVAIDPNLETSKKDIVSYEVGNSLLQCDSCKEIFAIDPDNVQQDENDSDTYRIMVDGEEQGCPNCNSKEGFKYIAQVAAVDDTSKEDSNSKEETNSKEEDSNTSDNTETKDVNNNLDNTIDNDLDNAEDIVEESFDNLINSYTNKIYKNVDKFKTNSVVLNEDNNLEIRGDLSLKDNRKIKTKFLLEAIKKNGDDFLFKGKNNILASVKNPYIFRGTLEEGKLKFNSLSYNYIEKIGEDNYLIEGLEKNK